MRLAAAANEVKFAMNTFKKYLALDLELNNAADGSTPHPKIIQVGVAWGSWDCYQDKSIQMQKWYIDPTEPIYPEITELTGITDADIAANAVPHQTVANDIAKIIKDNDCFINPITWGGGDSASLIAEFKHRNVVFPHFGRRWIDVKTWYIYSRMAIGSSITGGLSQCMPKFNIHFQGDAHRADIDAFNTLRLFFAMLDRQSKMEQLKNFAKEIK